MKLYLSIAIATIFGWLWANEYTADATLTGHAIFYGAAAIVWIAIALITSFISYLTGLPDKR